MQTISLGIYTNKLFCPFCRKKVLTNLDEDWDIEKSICKHVLYIYDNDGYLHYLSDEVKSQLKSKGYDLAVIEKLLIEDNQYKLSFSLSDVFLIVTGIFTS